MNLDITIHKGRLDKPTVIFIHGLGMDKRIWVNPDEAKILGGSFPLRVLLSKKPDPIDYGYGKEKPVIKQSRFSIGKSEEDLKTSFHDLRTSGYTVIAWSQKRPAGPVGIAAAELREIVKRSKRYSREGVILICHSRGGLIARKYLERGDESITGIITLATPHHGSTMAKWADYISPLASIVNSMLGKEHKRKTSHPIKRILNFITSKAIKELLPDSGFFHRLGDSIPNRVPCLSFGGTSPSLFKIYRWRLREKARRKILEPEVLFSIPDMLENIIPKKLYPEELKKGYGDGLVSAESSVLPGCKDHYNFNVNHAAILFDERVRKKIVQTMGLLG